VSPLRRNIRQRSRAYERNLGPCKLYLDDLDDIVRTVREAASQERAASVKRRVGEIRSELGLKPDEDLREGLENIIRQGNPDNRARAKNVLDLIKESEEGLVYEPLYEVELKAGDATAEEVEDLRSATNKELRKVEISCSRPSIVIWLHSIGAQVFSIAQDPDSDVRLLVDDIADFVNGRRVIVRRPRLGVLVLATVLLITGVGLLLKFPRWAFPYPRQGDWLLLGTLWLTLLLFVAVEQVVLRRLGSVVIVPERRDEMRGFSRVSRRDLVVALTSAIVGAFLATAGALIVANMTK
jgi:hypothetical protein